LRAQGAKPAKAVMPPELADFNAGQSEMRGLIERYREDLGNLNRLTRFPYSPLRLANLRKFYTEWVARLPQVEFDALSREGQVDYVLLRNELEYNLIQLDLNAAEWKEMEPLIGWAAPLVELEDARRRLEKPDPQKTAALLNQLNQQAEAAQKAVNAKIKPETPENKGKNWVEGVGVKKTVANRAANTLSQLRQILRAWNTFNSGYDPLFTWWVSEPYKSLDATLEKYGNFLREKLVGVRADDRTAIIGDPIGREALDAELRHEMIPYTPEELVAVARKEFEWCDAEMLKAARELGYGDDWKKALEYVKTLYVEPGQQTVFVRQLAQEAIDFLDKNDLLTIPQLARDTWRMEMMTPEAQLQNPFFLGGEQVIVSYPTNTMPHDAKMMSLRGNNKHFSRAVVHHELIPGHHLQGFMTNRYRNYREIFGTPFWTEGWALYWELQLYDMKFPQRAEDRIGMLFWRMHRCARIIFSLSFHLGTMSPQECVDFLIQRVGHESDNAYAEVRRSFAGAYPPLYQAGYLLGGIQIRQLYRELVPAGKMTNRAFHDAVLKNGPMPIEMVRASLTPQKLARDYKANWKFYGEKP
jgi:uncharacterized protein (DUF885 family)